MNDSVMTDHILKCGKDKNCFSYCKNKRVVVAMSHVVCCVYQFYASKVSINSSCTGIKLVQGVESLA